MSYIYKDWKRRVYSAFVYGSLYAMTMIGVREAIKEKPSVSKIAGLAIISGGLIATTRRESEENIAREVFSKLEEKV
ncbi:hypothetical protein HY450_01085 [Candidatus Pacearchaeota archaeon]|nr:hypothetical protein [Candidatus Pacearchaeota archaeon]